jgi:hypothetical protein
MSPKTIAKDPELAKREGEGEEDLPALLQVLETRAQVSGHLFRRLADSWVPQEAEVEKQQAAPTPSIPRIGGLGSKPPAPPPSLASLYSGEDRAVVRKRQAILEHKLLGAQRREQQRASPGSSRPQGPAAHGNGNAIGSDEGDGDEEEGGGKLASLQRPGRPAAREAVPYHDPMAMYMGNRRKRKK